MTSPSKPPPTITAIAAPWTLHGTIYTLAVWISSSTASLLAAHPSFLYSPLELDSSFANGKPVGGLAMIQIIRYTDSPVGTYDELVIVPGAFEKDEDEVMGKGEKGEKVKKRALKVTRIYVSQERTCWNGRNNWNLPKHLADFQFIPLPNGAMSITVRPYVLNPTTGIEEPAPATSPPFFRATFKTIPYLPGMPLSTDIAKYVGMDLSIDQPPLPAGNGSKGELCGTDDGTWSRVTPLEASSNSRVGWWDLRQSGGGEEDENVGKGEGWPNWWPGIGRWKLGVVMENAVLNFVEGKRWA